MDPKENGDLPAQGRGFIPGHGDSIPAYGEHGIIGWMEPLGGLTKREHFAAMAMQGILASFPETASYCEETAANTAVAHADALLRALAAGGEG